jgi:hypothetical protein
MDLDSFQKDYQDFKSRVAPMLAEYEAAVKRMVGLPVSEEDKAAAADLHTAIHAPLPANSTMLPIAEGDAAIAAASTAMAPKPVPGPAPDALRSDGRLISSDDRSAGHTAGGPTIQQWVASGYKASAYPPSPYASQSSPEDVAAAQAAEIEAAAAKAPAPQTDDAAAAAALQAEIHKPLPPTAPVE